MGGKHRSQWPEWVAITNLDRPDGERPKMQVSVMVIITSSVASAWANNQSHSLQWEGSQSQVTPTGACPSWGQSRIWVVPTGGNHQSWSS